jgi:hypothetical protein
MVNKTWHLVEQHGCWWAYEGELPPPEAFTTHRRSATCPYSAPFPRARWQRRDCSAIGLVAAPKPRPTVLLHLGADGDSDVLAEPHTRFGIARIRPMA